MKIFGKINLRHSFHSNINTLTDNNLFITNYVIKHQKYDKNVNNIKKYYYGFELKKKSI